ncbi:MAG: endonuclease VIII [Bacteroidales bacterium]|nr:endonuclease VIII [Bacteroidales bacterium]
MMELPESYSLAKQITKELKGKTIIEVIILQTPHKFAFFKNDISKYPDMLINQTITGAVFKGGMLEIDTIDSQIVFSDGTTPRYYTNADKLPKKHQFALIFDDNTALFCSIRMYGFIIVSPLGKCDEEYYLSSSTKLNPLSEGFTYDYFRSLYDSKCVMSVKGFLATEQRIPGLGNGVLQDILLEAGIDPRFKMSNATEDDFHKLYNAIMLTIKSMCEKGGRNSECDIFGNPGGYISKLCKNTLGKPCLICGNTIKKTQYMGGTVYFCDKCQKQL